jgi:predicted transcriptional regulator
MVTLDTLSDGQAKVLGFIRESGKQGMTRDEVAVTWGVDSNRVTGRISELTDAGIILKTDKKRRTRAGKLAAVYVVNDTPEETVKRPGDPDNESSDYGW